MERSWKEGRQRPPLLLLALVAAHLALLRVGDLSAGVGWTVAVLFIASLVLWVGVGWLGRVPPTGLTVIAGAALLRLLLLPLAPSLSDDILRYIWDGKALAAGFNPYILAPDAPELRELDPELRERLPHRDVPTVYPPVAVALFAIAARLPSPILSLRLLLVLADLVTCWLLLLIAQRRNVARRRVLLYAWNPLVTLEIAAMGHVDALGLAAVVATVFFLLAPPRRVLFAGLAAAVSVLAKVVPLVAWPSWARQSRQPVRFLLIAIGIVAVTFMPIVLAAGGAPEGYVRFGVSWEFNGPLYEPLWRLVEWVRAPAAIEGLLEGIKSATGWHEPLNRLFPYNYPQFIARLLLVVASIPWFAKAWRDRDVLQSTGTVFGILLLFSATVYPWYVLWVLPWAALNRSRSWILLAALLPLSYLPQYLDVELVPAIFCAIWVPFFVLLGMEKRWFAS